MGEERKKRLSRGGEGDNPYFGIPPRMGFLSKGLCPGRIVRTKVLIK